MWSRRGSLITLQRQGRCCGRMRPLSSSARSLKFQPTRVPWGTMNHPVTPLRSLAVDPAAVPLGVPVWIEVEGPEPFCRLMVAQDTGSAIKGAQRADIFFGTGPDAGLKAGRVRAGGRIVVLLPAQSEDEGPP